MARDSKLAAVKPSSMTPKRIRKRVKKMGKDKEKEGPVCGRICSS